MNEAIAHASHLPPLDTGEFQTGFLRDLLRCLANDLHAAHERALEDFVAEKRLPRGSSRLGFQKLHSAQDVAQQLNRGRQHSAR
jgi:hypothetical protein